MQGLDGFDAVDPGAHSVQDSGLVPRAGANFQNFEVGGDFQEAALKGHGVRLRDGLAFSNGHGLVLVGHFAEGMVQEKMPWDLPHGLQNGRVGDAFGFQFFDELPAHTLVTGGIP